MNNDMLPIGTTLHINPEDIKWEQHGGDLISREALKSAIDKFIGYLDEDMIYRIKVVIDNAPTELFPLTVKIKDNVTDEDKEVLKRLMNDYKPQVLNLETDRPKGEWIIIDDCEQFIAKCSVCGRIVDSRMAKDYPSCPYCLADMRKGGTEND